MPPARRPFVPGDQPCSESGCDRVDGAQCAYEDRAGERCATAWCRYHQHAIGTASYCRRHLGTLRAVGDEALLSRTLPLLTDRAPSLVRWTVNDLDEAVRAALETTAFERPGSCVLVEPLRWTPEPPGDGGRWVFAWLLTDLDGVLARVDVDVSDENPAEVTLRVNGVVILRQEPPWIARRSAPVPPEVDEEQRRRHHDDLVAAVTDALRDAPSPS